MQKQLLLVAGLLMILFFGCKKDKGSEDIKQDIKNYYSLQNKIAKQFQATISDTITDEYAHSERLLAWIRQQPDVVEATMHDVYVFDVKHTNGFSGNIMFRPKQTDLRLATRGAGSKTDGKLHAFNTSDDEKIITNKNVLIIIQTSYDFYGGFTGKQINDLLDLFEYSEIDFNVTLRQDEGINAFLDLSDFGIILIATHGTPTGLSSGSDVFETGGGRLIAFSDDVEVADLPDDAASRLRSGDYKLTSLWQYEALTREMTLDIVSYELTFSFFQSLPVQLDNTVMIGNYCYSGIQNGIMGQVLAPKGLKTFYGYAYNTGRSGTVTNDLCWRAEDTIITNLIARDTTGIAHLAYNNTIALSDTCYWNDLTPHKKQRYAERNFIFSPQTLNHYLDKGYHFDDCGDTITDSRDGQQYPTVCIGEQVWMAKNLNWAGAGTCYNGSASLCTTFGRLYTWAEVMDGADTTSASPSGVRGICPQGWHVPSLAEWQKLVTHLGGSAVAGGKLKSTDNIWNQPNIGATNETEFAALPAGLYDSDDGAYEAGTYWAVMWSTTQNTSNTDPYYYTLELRDSNTGANLYENNGSDRVSCRCVKD